MKTTSLLLRSLFLLSLICPMMANAAKKPLRVYILVGQSNMVGQGHFSTMDYIGEDPATKELHKSMLGKGGKYRTCDRVWISSLNGKMRTQGGVGAGKLKPGYGNRKDEPSLAGECIGPEYTFGITMEENYDGPILIIKAAWGGHSLLVDYRPPSAGPYVMPEAKVAKLKQKPGNLEKHEAMNKEFTHKYYRSMMEHVKTVLGDIESVYPGYDKSAGYELGGFVWFQGWNDYASKLDYPEEAGDKQYDQYSELLAHFIRDIRKDLDAPKLPFVIGVCGINGNHTPGTYNDRANPQERMERFRKAMAAPASMSEFKGNVFAVPTAPFWDDQLAALEMKQGKVKRMRSAVQKKSPSGPNADGKMSQAEMKKFIDDYTKEVFTEEELVLKKRAMAYGGFIHYHGSAKFYARAGEAFAKALLE